MVNFHEAVSIAKKSLPKGKIQKSVEYKNWYLFVIFLSDPFEETMDAIYSVNKQTGEFRDFPYMKEEYFEEVMNLLEKVPSFGAVS